MSDIALCTDTTCPSRDSCRRATTPAQDRQVYAAFQRNGQERCGHYLVAAPAGSAFLAGSARMPGRLGAAMIELPWPPRELSPNARVHWARRSKAAKAYKQACYLLTKQAGIQAPEGRVLLALEFAPPDRRRRDDDNILAAFKSGRDGIADALGIDDSRFVTQFSVSQEPVNGGAVRVRISEHVEGDEDD